MEHAIDISNSFEHMKDMSGVFSSIGQSWRCSDQYDRNKTEEYKFVNNMLMRCARFSSMVYEFEKSSVGKSNEPAVFQLHVSTFWLAQFIYSALFLAKIHYTKTPILTSELHKKLKKTINEHSQIVLKLKKFLVEKSDFPLDKAILKSLIGTYELRIPIHIYVEDDDTGKLVSVFELPQVYGFGETEKEAIAMLDREILSLHKELKDDDKYSLEFKIVKHFLDINFK